MSGFLPDGFRLLQGLPGELAVYQVGAGRPEGLPLVLLPGIEGDPRLFLRQLPLAERRPVWAVGHAARGGLMERGRALLAVAPPRFLAVGLSLGGLVGWAAACAAPERVAGLLAVNTLPARALCPPGIARQRRLLSALPGPLFDLLYRARIRRRMLAEGAPPWLAEALALPERDALLDRLDAVLGWDLPGPPPVPARWLRGQTEAEAPWSPEEVPDHLPGVGVEVIPGGHRAPLTHPAPFHGALLQWAAGLR